MPNIVQNTGESNLREALNHIQDAQARMLGHQNPAFYSLTLAGKAIMRELDRQQDGRLPGGVAHV